jgi:hypothetical protein
MTKHKITGILFRWIIFCIIFFSLFQFIEPLFDPHSTMITRSILHDVILSKDLNYDVLFIGSSHILTSINPALIDQILPIHSAVLQLPAAGINDSYFLLRKAVNSGKKPRVVVLDSYTFLYNRAIGIDAFNLFERLIMIKDALQFFPPEEHLSNFSSLFLNHNTWQKVNLFKGIWKEFYKYKLSQTDLSQLENLWKNYYSFSYSLIETASMAQYKQQVSLPAVPFDEYHAYQLLRFATYCRSNGIKLIIIDIPALNTSLVPLDAMEEFAENNQVSFYKFDSIFRDTYDNRYIFFLAGGTNSHMNHDGKRLFTVNYIGPMLAEEMGWEYDQKAADKLTKLVQIGLEVKGVNNTAEEKITFILTPLNPELALEYNWVLKNNEKIIQEQSGKSNSFSINKSYWGIEKYSIQVTVTNPKNIDEGLKLNIPLF